MFRRLLISLMVAVIICFPLSVAAESNGQITLDVPRTISAGENLIIKGTSTSSSVVIRVWHNGAILLYDTQNVINGTYSTTPVTVPASWSGLDLRIVVNDGEGKGLVGEATITVLSKTGPTPTPEPKPSPAPTGTPVPSDGEADKDFEITHLAETNTLLLEIHKIEPEDDITVVQITGEMEDEIISAINTYSPLSVLEVRGAAVEGALGYNVQMSGSFLKNILEKSVDKLRITAGNYYMEINIADLNLHEIEDDDIITFSISIVFQGATSDLSSTLEEGRPCVLVDIKVNGESLQQEVKELKFILALPYVSQAGEKTSSILGVKVELDGSTKVIKASTYRPEEKKLVMVATGLGTYGIDYREASFSDIDMWAKEYIEYMASRDIVKGVGGGRFDPQTNITREDFITLFVNAFDLAKDVDTSKNPFEDVKKGSYYEKAIVWAYEKGIVSGMGNNRFGVRMPMTREDMATFTYKLLKAENIELPVINERTAFKDSLKIAPYAREAVYALQQADIIKGLPDGTYNPKGFTTRAEAATIIYKIIQLLLD